VPVTREDRRQKLESFGRAPELLAAALRQFPRKMWLYKPAPNHWSIHETILHLADSEANAYIRCRRLIAEPGKPVLIYDAGVWADTLGYFHQSTKEAFELLRRLRRMTYQLLINLPEQVWSNTAEQPEKGTQSLDQWLEMQERHIPYHIEQMRRNYEEWARTHPPRRAPSRPQKFATESAGAKLAALNADR
jgi:DinB superfamily